MSSGVEIMGDGDSRLQSALSVIVGGHQFQPSLSSFAHAISCIDADDAVFRIYLALSHLRHGHVRVILQCLLSRVSDIDFVNSSGSLLIGAIVRVLAVLRTGPEVDAACEKLKTVADSHWNLRSKALLAYVARTRARDAIRWGDTLAALASYRPTEVSEGEFTAETLEKCSVFRSMSDEEREMRCACAYVLGAGRANFAKFLPPVISWFEQTVVCDVQKPSLWREISWGEFAQRCGRGQIMPCIPQQMLANSYACTVSGTVPNLCDDPAYVTLFGIRLERRSCRRHNGVAAVSAESSCSASSRAVSESDTRIADKIDAERTVTSDSNDAIFPGFIETENAASAGLEVAIGLADGRPILLEGPSGCGKSSLIEHMAICTSPLQLVTKSLRDDGSIVRVQLDSLTSASADDDIAALVGCVVPLPEGHGFRWQPGPIGLAIERGCWLFLENVPSASQANFMTSLVSQLSRLRPGDTMDVPGREIPLVAARGFTVIATCSFSGEEECHVLSSDWEPPGGWIQWRRVTMTALTESEISCILLDRFAVIKDCVARVIGCIDAVKNALLSRYGRGVLSMSRLPDMRDAVKLCRRLSSLRTRCSGDCLTPETAFMESVDVLCSWERDDKVLAVLHAAVSSVWSVSPEVAHILTGSQTPSFVINEHELKIGRSMLRTEQVDNCQNPQFQNLALTGHLLRLLEQLGRSVEMKENVLLCGESGTGKTAAVQELAALVGKKLVVVNMSRSSDLADLIGSYRPIDMRTAIANLARNFEKAFCSTMSREKNSRFLKALRSASRNSSNVARALRLMRGAINALPKTSKGHSRVAEEEWRSVSAELIRLEQRIFNTRGHAVEEGVDCSDEERQPLLKKRKVRRVGSVSAAEDRSVDSVEPSVGGDDSRRSSFDFEFVEGALTIAMREGHWILLDELNMAPTEILERLVGLLDDKRVHIPDPRVHSVSCVDGFVLFAAMNPPTDAGKRALPRALRSRLTEFNVHDSLNREDLALVIGKRLFGYDWRKHDRAMTEQRVALDTADFYLSAREACGQGSVCDVTGRKVRYSLRSLTRMLSFASAIAPQITPVQLRFRYALSEGAELAFVTPLPREYRDSIRHIGRKTLLREVSGVAASTENLASSRNSNGIQAIRNTRLSPPCDVPFVKIAGFYVECRTDAERPCHSAANALEGQVVAESDVTAGSDFIITDTVERTLRDVCRALTVGAPQLPILLQGPTAAGKTSLISFLAKQAGRKLVRINNHEHTDISEYLGTYIASADGTLVFQEGPLVQAARHGDWVVLDELNLAPPDILEALNRLLDDNREIRIPETGACVRPAHGFMLFATQNPPGLYGGRKEFSQAFRGRFIEVHVDELSDSDLRTILLKRTGLPVSFADSMISVMRDLQTHRRSSQIFHGKSGFMTARDLFRWAARCPRSRTELAVEGFFLLGERARVEAERDFVRHVLAQRTGVAAHELSDEFIYNPRAQQEVSESSNESAPADAATLWNRILAVALSEGISLTPSMVRMLTLLSRCALRSEPSVLVGGTGSGKTTACRLISTAMGLQLATVNCHRHSEASDFLGSYRPSKVDVADSRGSKKLFEWVDGPLVSAMKLGTAFLADEINMADDAVTERLNSVLETDRSIVLSEKGCNRSNDSTNADVESRFALETVAAKQSFLFFATMNPGGDFGKKELSPALRNRFTEIWVPNVFTREDYVPVVTTRVLAVSSSVFDKHALQRLHQAAEAIVDFVCRFSTTGRNQHLDNAATASGDDFSSASSQFHVTLRDATSWAECVREFFVRIGMDPMLGFVHGARLVFLDGLTVGFAGGSNVSVEKILWQEILALIPEDVRLAASTATFDENVHLSVTDRDHERELKVGPFTIARNMHTKGQECSASCSGTSSSSRGFCFSAKTTRKNVARLARAVALDYRPILMEGPPGCGKSSLVLAVASTAQIPVMRVNLSEHTEMSDLVGGFVPSGEHGSFSFQNGPLLTAMLGGCWILLDELNLASQSVLEGLNSILDHRRSIFVPEIGREFFADAGFRVFGAQNAVFGGGGRRGLPRSFLNRFTRVAVEPYSEDDVIHIAKTTHPQIESIDIQNIVRTVRAVNGTISRGSSEEALNLRDVLRWCDLLDGISESAWDFDCAMHAADDPVAHENDSSVVHLSQTSIGDRFPDIFFSAVVLQRLSSEDERRAACQAFKDNFGHSPEQNSVPSLKVCECGRFLRVGKVKLERGELAKLIPDPGDMLLHKSRFESLEALALSVAANWPVIVSSGCHGNTDASDAVELVQTLAILSGRELVEFNVSSGVDSGDLLGGYFQRECVNEFYRASTIVLRAYEKVILDVTCRRPGTLPFKETGVVSRMEVCRERIERGRRSCDEDISSLFSDLLEMAGVLEQASLLSPSIAHACETASRGYSCLKDVVQSAISKVSDLQRSSTAFEWRKSTLLEAIEKGSWVLIRDADKCRPAVLDRLNPFFERPALSIVHPSDRSKIMHGSTCDLLPEAPPEEDGSVRTLNRHHDFRLFMTVDERRGATLQHGLSAALRNRSVQICLHDCLTDEERRLLLFWRGISCAEASQVCCQVKDVIFRNPVSAASGDNIFVQVGERLRYMFAHGVCHSVTSCIKHVFPAVLSADCVASEQNEDLHCTAATSFSCPSQGLIVDSELHQAYGLTQSAAFGRLLSCDKISSGCDSEFLSRDLSILRLFSASMMQAEPQADCTQPCSQSHLLPTLSTASCTMERSSRSLGLSMQELFYKAEAFLASANTFSGAQDRRDQLLFDATWWCLVSGDVAFQLRKAAKVLDVYLRPSQSRNQLAHGQLTAGFVCCDVALDPLYALDFFGQNIINRNLSPSKLLARRKAAVAYRLELVCIGILRSVWRNATEYAFSSCTNREGSLFLKSLRRSDDESWDLEHETGMGHDILFYPYHLLRCMIDTVDMFMSGIEIDGTSWSAIDEFHLTDIFVVATKLCDFLHSSLHDQDDHLVHCIGMMRLFCEAIPYIENVSAFADLKSVLRSLEIAIKAILDKLGFYSVCTRSVPMPRNSRGLFIEQEIIELLKKWPSSMLTVAERKSVSEVLVLLTSSECQHRNSLLEALTEIPTSIARNCDRRSASTGCDQPRSATSLNLVRKTLRLSKEIALIAEMASNARCLPSGLHIDGCQEMNQWAKELRLCLDSMHYEGLPASECVPFQRILWSVDALTGFSGADLQPKCAADMYGSLVEALTIIFKSLTRSELPGDESRSDTRTRYEDLSYGLTGSEVTFGFLRDLTSSLESQDAGNVIGRLFGTATAACVAIDGCSAPFSPPSAVWKSATNLLNFALYQVMELGFSKYPRIKEEVIFRADLLSICLDCSYATVIRGTETWDEHHSACAQSAVLSVAAGVSELQRKSEQENEKDAFEKGMLFGQAWVAVGLANISLLSDVIASMPFDPCALVSAEFSIASSLKSTYEAKRRAYLSTESVRHGSVAESINYPAEQASQGISLYASKQLEAERRLIVRPDNVASFTELQDVVIRLADRYVRNASVKDVAQKFSELYRKTSLHELSLVSESAEEIKNAFAALSARFEFGGEFGHFRELGSGISLGLRQVIFGLSSCSQVLKAKAFNESRSRMDLFRFVKDLLDFPRISCMDERQPVRLLSECVKAEANASVVLLVLNFVILHAERDDEHLITELTDAFNYLVGMWKSRLVVDEDRASRERSLYRVRAALDEAAVQDVTNCSGISESVEADFVGTFDPVQGTESLSSDAYDLESESVVQKSDDHFRVSSSRGSSCKSDHRNNFQTDPMPQRGYSDDDSSLTASKLWCLYEKMTTYLNPPKKRCDCSLLTDRHNCLKDSLVELGARVMTDGNYVADLPGCMDFSSSTSFLCASFALQRAIGCDLTFESQSTTGATSEPLSNFYSDSNVSEVLRGAEAVRAVVDAARGLQREQFSDIGGHPVLGGVIVAAEKALAMDVCTPLSVLTRAYEGLLRKIGEWQKHFARKAMKLDKEARAVTGIVFHWRRLEIDSWEGLLDLRVQNVAVRAERWFFYFYDAIFCSSVDFAQPENDLLSTLDQFLRSAPVGEFSTRLRVLRLLSAHMQLLKCRGVGDAPKLARYINGLTGYYGLYVEQIERRVRNARNDLGSQVKEQAVLARWRTENDVPASDQDGCRQDMMFERLRSMSEHTKRKLHQYCRQMDSVLRVPVSEAILESQNDIGIEDILSTSTSMHNLSCLCKQHESCTLCPARERGLDCVKNWLVDLFTIGEDNTRSYQEPSTAPETSRVRRLPELSRRMQSLFLGTESAVNIGSVGLHDLREVIRHRVESLQKLPSAAVSIKKKALIDLLRGLKNAGLSPNQASVPAWRRNPLFWLAVADFVPESQDVLEHCRTLHFKCARGIQRLHEASVGSNLHTDITRKEASQMNAYCAFLFDKSILEKQSVSEALVLSLSIMSHAKHLSEAAVSTTPVCQAGAPLSTASTASVDVCGFMHLSHTCARLDSIANDLQILVNHVSFVLRVFENRRNDEAVGFDSFPINDMHSNVASARSAAHLLSQGRDCLLRFNVVARAAFDECSHFIPRPEMVTSCRFLNENQVRAYHKIVSAMSLMEQNMTDLLAEASELSPTNLANIVLGPISAFLSMRSHSFCVKHDPSNVSQESCGTQIVEQAEKVIDSVLLGSQQMLRWTVQSPTMEAAASSGPVTDQEMLPDGIFSRVHAQISDLVRIANLVNIDRELKRLSQSFECVPRSCNVEDAEKLARGTGRFVCHFVQTVLLPIFSECIRYHMNAMQLLLTLTSLFVGLCGNGFCRPPSAEGNASCEERAATHEGTGFGDVGDGDISLAQDVSHEIENENQLTDLDRSGLNRDDERNTDSANVDTDFNTGFDMENDFDGAVFDLPDGSSDDNLETGAEQHQETSVPEERFGDTSEVGDNIVDERLWDEGHDQSKPEFAPEQASAGKAEFRGSDEEISSRMVGGNGTGDGDEPSDHFSSVERGKETCNDTENSVADDVSCSDRSTDDNSMHDRNPSAPEISHDRNTRDKSADDLAAERFTEDVESDPAQNTNNRSQQNPQNESDCVLESSSHAHSREWSESAADNLSVSSDQEDNSNEPEVQSVPEEEDARNDNSNTVSAGTNEAEAVDTNDIDLESDRVNESMDHPSAEQPSNYDAMCTLPIPESQNVSDTREESGAVEFEKNLSSKPGMIAVDNAPAAVSEERDHWRNGPDRGGNDLALGSVGGEMNLSAARDQEMSRHSSSPAAGVGNAVLEYSKQPGQATTMKSDYAKRGTAMDKVEETCSRSLADEPNPFRAVAEEDLVEHWKRRVKSIRDLSSSGDTSDAQDELGGHEGEFEFLNRESIAFQPDDKNSWQYAHGAATSEQQRALDKSTGTDRAMDIEEQAGNDKSDAEWHISPAQNIVDQGVLGGQDMRGSEFDDDNPLDERDEPHHSSNEQINRDDVRDEKSSAETNPTGRLSAQLELKMKDTAALVDWTRTNKDAPAMTEDTIPQNGNGRAWDLWRQLEASTSKDAANLCEQLRLVLEPTLRTGLAGDFRTGKRLNMKRLVDYVASDFRRDRIWLRRLRPERRNYDIMLAIDDSQSMSESGAGPIALQALALLCAALARLEVGRLAVATFGTDASLVRKFDEPLSMDISAGDRLISQFTFSQKDTNVRNLLDLVLSEMTEGSRGPVDGIEELKLVFIVSDGRLTERDEVRRRIHELQSRRVLVALIVVDCTGDSRKSIFELKKVEFDGSHAGKVKVSPYMEKFPIDFYAVVNDVSTLPQLLADGLRQWFELVHSAV